MLNRTAPVVLREECSSNNSSDEDPTLVGSNAPYSSSNFEGSEAESPPFAFSCTIADNGVSSSSRVDEVSSSLHHFCRRRYFQGSDEGEVAVDRRQWEQGEEVSHTNAERDRAQGENTSSTCGTGIIGGILACDTEDTSPMLRCLAETATWANQTEGQQGSSGENGQGDFPVPFPKATTTELVLGFSAETSAKNSSCSTPPDVPATGITHLTISSPSSLQSPSPQHPRALRYVSKEAAEAVMVREKSQDTATSTAFAALEANLERWGVPPAFPPRPPPLNLDILAMYPTRRCHMYQPPELSQQYPASGVKPPSGFDGVYLACHSLEPSPSFPAPLVQAVSQPPTLRTEDDTNLSSGATGAVTASEKTRSSRSVLFDRTWLDGFKLQHHKRNKNIDSYGRDRRHAGCRAKERNLGRRASGNICGSAPSAGTSIAKSSQEECLGLEGSAAAGGAFDRRFHLREDDVDWDREELQKKKRQEGVEVVVPTYRYPRWHEERKGSSLANACTRMTEDVLQQTADIGNEGVLATSFKRPWLPSQLKCFQA